MNTSDNNYGNTFGDYLLAELRGQMSSMKLSAEDLASFQIEASKAASDCGEVSSDNLDAPY